MYKCNQMLPALHGLPISVYHMFKFLPFSAFRTAGILAEFVQLQMPVSPQALITKQFDNVWGLYFLQNRICMLCQTDVIFSAQDTASVWYHVQKFEILHYFIFQVACFMSVGLQLNHWICIVNTSQGGVLVKSQIVFSFDNRLPQHNSR